MWLRKLDVSEERLEGSLGLEAAMTISFVSSLGQLAEAKGRC